MRTTVSRRKKAVTRKQVAIVPNLQPTCTYRIIALDPSIKGADGKVLTSDIEIPNEELSPGPRGYRVQVIDYDASNRILYKPDPYRPEDLMKVPENPEKDRAFHARNVYVIVMRVLARFERALGRRVAWSFDGHQLTIAPHAFLDLNAYYSKEDRAIFFGYYPDGDGFVFTSLSHEVIAHETTHALVDGLRNQYLRPSSPDQAAFHEAFADIVALLSVVSLREVVSAGLDLTTSMDRGLVKASKLTEDSLKKGVLFGLAHQVGEAMYGMHGVPLRRSITLNPDTALKDNEEYIESHRRGEILVAAVMGAFLKVWKQRIDLYGKLQGGMVSRLGVVDASVETAEHLLTMAIRALDYCPPTDLLFGDFLSAMLTADYEMHPDDSRYEYRRHLRESFHAFGFEPGSDDTALPEPGLWGPPDRREALRYGRNHLASMQHDKDEIFRFIWENRNTLGVDEGAYTNVEGVVPCYRVSSDGFVLQETVATYSQQVRMQASELKSFGLKKPVTMPDDQDLTIYGGGALIFDDSGRLKYQVRNRIRSAARQNPRLEYLWESGELNTQMAFGALHLDRVLHGHTAHESETQSQEEDDAD
jgi:hypothetical protein